MGVFESRKSFPGIRADLERVAADVEAHFKQDGFETQTEKTLTGVLVSIRKGNIFKAVLGLKTALNIEVESGPTGVNAKASVGLFGSQAIPTAITLLLAWPVVLTQIWGLIHQAKLDEEAMEVVERSVTQRIQVATLGEAHALLPENGPPPLLFCTQCGGKIPSSAKFCASCGAAVNA